MAVMENIKKKKGFTLIEIVVVMAIIAVLAVLVVGAIMIARSQSRDTKYTADAKTIRDILESYYADHQRYPCREVNADDSCKTNYGRVNAYSLFDETVEKNDFPGAFNAAGELADYIDSSSFPQGNRDRVCFSTCGGGCPAGKGGDYFLWIVTEEENRDGEGCNRQGDSAGDNENYKPGYARAIIKIHGPQNWPGPSF